MELAIALASFSVGLCVAVIGFGFAIVLRMPVVITSALIRQQRACAADAARVTKSDPPAAAYGSTASSARDFSSDTTEWGTVLRPQRSAPEATLLRRPPFTARGGSPVADTLRFPVRPLAW